MRVYTKCLFALSLGIATAGSLSASRDWEGSERRFERALGGAPQREIVVGTALRASLRLVLHDRPAASLAATAATGSMEPTFDENYVVVLEACPFEQIRPGDVVLSNPRPWARPVMHRVVQAGFGFTLYTQGDALTARDPEPLTPANYLGRRVVAALELHTGAIVWLSPQS